LLVAPGAHFVVLHAWRLREERLMRELELKPERIAMYRSRARDAAQKRLATCMASFFRDVSSRIPQASPMLGHGAPQRVIAECAKQVGADLIVLGRGPSTCRLAAQADCDVLIDE
jgi:nucleotide-binding universal stress UspA family protein